MSITEIGEHIEHRQVSPVRQHRAASLRSRLLLMGAQVGIRSLVAGWMLAPDLPWPTWVIDDVARWLPRPRHTRIGAVGLPHCRAEWVRARGAGTKRAMLYLHGGAFLTCGLNTHRAMVSCLSRAADAPVLNVGYRMLPRHPISSALADAIDGYRWLSDAGYGEGDIVIAGDSAGGYLAFMTALSVLDMDLPRPAGIATISPMTDISDGRAECGMTNGCAMFPPRAAVVFSRYLARAHARITVDGQAAPLISPVAEDLRRMPPVMIHAGAAELLTDDAKLMADRLGAAGVPCELHLWQGQVHAFAVAADATPESHRAINTIGRFVQDVTTGRSAPAHGSVRRSHQLPTAS